jgi:hypothetical protein
MIYLYCSRPILNHIIEMISFCLTEYNIEHKMVQTVNYESPTDLWIGLWHGLDQDLPKNSITLNVEPLRKECWVNCSKKLFSQSMHVIEYSPSHLDIYKEWNISNVSILPFGYCKLHENIYNQHVNNSDPIVKDIDVLYYGALTERRHRCLLHFSTMCHYNGINFVLRNNNLYGYEEKAKLISRSKIVISMCHDEPVNLKSNDLLRLSFLISNKAFVLVEDTSDPIEEILKKTMIFYNSVMDLFGKCQYYLQHSEERDAIVNATYEHCKENLNLVKSFPIDIIKHLQQNIRENTVVQEIQQ